MLISDADPSSVILSQNVVVEHVKSDAQKCQNKVKPKRDVAHVMSPQNYNFNEFQT